MGERPHGALTEAQLMAFAHIKGKVIYKVWGNAAPEDVPISVAVLTGKIDKKNQIIEAIDKVVSIAVPYWYSHDPPLGYLFDNYFYALACALKIRAKAKVAN